MIWHFFVKLSSIYSDRLQSQREEALADFVSSNCNVLIATDVLSRGHDIQNLKVSSKSSSQTPAPTRTHPHPPAPTRTRTQTLSYAINRRPFFLVRNFLLVDHFTLFLLRAKPAHTRPYIDNSPITRST